MKHRWTTFTLVLAALVAFTGPALGALWVGTGDGTNWSDSANWSTDPLIPLTTNAGADASALIESDDHPGTNDIYIVLDAATASTFVSSNQANGVINSVSRTNDPARIGTAITVNLDWGPTPLTNGNFNIGLRSTDTGSISYVQTDGTIYWQTASYVGRGSPPGQQLVYEVQGGTFAPRQLVLGGRTGSDPTKADCTLRINGGTFDIITPTESGLFVSNTRFQWGGAFDGTATVEISGVSTAKIYDVRMDRGGQATAGNGGSTYFRVIGSQATVLFDHNFNTDQDGKSNLVNQVEWIADAGGVSAIRAYDVDATWRPKSSTTVLVDLTDYTGDEDLVLAEYSRYDGGLFGDVTIVDPLNRGYQFVVDNEGDFTDLDTNGVMRTRVTLTPPSTWTAISASGGVVSMTYGGPTYTGATFKLEASTDLTNPAAWTATGLELLGNGSDLVFTNDADAAFEAYRVTD